MKQFYLSECGQYVARCAGTWGAFEVWTADGAIHWRHDNRIKTWADAKEDRRPMVYATGGFSAHKTGQKKGSFTVYLLHCDPTKIVVPWTGNTVIERLNVVFRRKIPSGHSAKWERRLGLA